MIKKFVLGVFVMSVAGLAWFMFIREEEQPVQLTLVESIESNEIDSAEDIEPAYQFDSVRLQQVVDQWVKKQSGTASVVITDPNNPDEPLVSHQPKEVYFAASLYKLFVVYEGYKTLDSGRFESDEPYLYGANRAECLDKALRSSDSPCAEAWWTELGKENLNEDMQALGLLNTSLTGIRTTAEDSARFMSLVWNGEGLSDQSRELYLNSLLEQEPLYRRGLPSGFSETMKVYNKVGWNLNKEWHDVAVVDFGENKILVIAVLTENVGMSNLAELSSAIENVASENIPQ